MERTVNLSFITEDDDEFANVALSQEDWETLLAQWRENGEGLTLEEWVSDLITDWLDYHAERLQEQETESPYEF